MRNKRNYKVELNSIQLEKLNTIVSQSKRNKAMTILSYMIKHAEIETLEDNTQLLSIISMGELYKKLSRYNKEIGRTYFYQLANLLVDLELLLVRDINKKTKRYSINTNLSKSIVVDNKVDAESYKSLYNELEKLKAENEKLKVENEKLKLEASKKIDMPINTPEVDENYKNDITKYIPKNTEEPLCLGAISGLAMRIMRREGIQEDSYVWNKVIEKSKKKKDLQPAGAEAYIMIILREKVLQQEEHMRKLANGDFMPKNNTQKTFEDFFNDDFNDEPYQENKSFMDLYGDELINNKI